jgi:hypothetical protein
MNSETHNQIRVRLLNHSYLAIESNAHQEMELREFFAFFVPGYKYMPAYKRKVWDGRVKLYNTVTKTLNVGLYHHLRKFCADRFYPLQILEHEEYGIPSAITISNRQRQELYYIQLDEICQGK